MSRGEAIRPMGIALAMASRPPPARVVHVCGWHVVDGPDPGVPDEEIQSAKRSRRLLDELIGALARREVRGIRAGVDAKSLDLRDNPVGVLPAAAVPDGDVHPE